MEAARGYRAVKEEAGWRERSTRAKVRVSGPDRVSFLQAMISNDIASKQPPAGVYSTLLTATGKIIADFYLYRFADFLLIDVEEELRSKLVEKLSSYIIMDDVSLEDVSSEYSQFSLQGPAAVELVRCRWSVAVPDEPLAVAETDGGEGKIWWVRKNELSPVGVEWIGPREAAPEVRAWLEDSAAAEIEPESLDILRLERGIPLYGRDMTEKNNPIEVGLRSAYSLSKGCYVGQEVLAKATNIGGVARLLTRLRLAGGVCPPAGSKVAAGDGKEIGWITSAVFSPDEEAVLAFAYLKRAFSSRGQLHRVLLEGGETVEGEVISRMPEEDE